VGTARTTEAGVVEEVAGGATAVLAVTVECRDVVDAAVAKWEEVEVSMVAPMDVVVVSQAVAAVSMRAETKPRLPNG